jgi:O-methyltransferase involved in polyketide biosynthesis
VDVYGEALTIKSVDVEVSPSFNNEYNLTFLASTAGSIAAYRAAVTFLNSSYIDDPFAIMFAREINPDKLAAAKLKNASELARFAVRTRFFDEFLRESVFRSGIRQVLA